MLRRIAALAALAFIVAVLPAPAASNPATGAALGRYIVVLDDAVPFPGGVANRHAALLGGHVGYVYSHVFRGYSIAMPHFMAGTLARMPGVASVEADGVATIDTTQSGAPWGLDRIDQRNRPLNGQFNYTRTGSGVKAYIIDTGIRFSHSQFGGRAISGRDTYSNDNDSSDCNGHGTHVAGTVGGSTYGVAKAVTLVGVRVLSCSGSGSWSQVIAGMDWVTADHVAGQPAVANLSLGGGANSSVDAAVNRMVSDGIAVSVAAGNGNFFGFAQDACSSSPARVPAAMTISATDSSDRKASWANYGTCVDLFAPGVSITSSWHNGDNATRTISGTSMAAPHTAGVAALYLQGNPGASPATVASALVGNATTGVVSNAGSGSPNRLLFTNY